MDDIQQESQVESVASAEAQPDVQQASPPPQSNVGRFSTREQEGSQTNSQSVKDAETQPIKFSFEGALDKDGRLSEGWTKGLRQDIRDSIGEDKLSEYERRYPELNSMVKNIADMERAIGKKGVVPPDLDDIEAIQKHGQEVLGAPKKSEEYSFGTDDLNLPDNYPTEHLSKQIDVTKQIAHKWGIPDKALSELASEVIKGEKSFFMDASKMREEAIAARENKVIEEIGGEQNIQNTVHEARTFLSKMLPGLRTEWFDKLSEEYPEITLELSRGYKRANMGEGRIDLNGATPSTAKTPQQIVDEYIKNEGGFNAIQSDIHKLNKFNKFHQETFRNYYSSGA